MIGTAEGASELKILMASMAIVVMLTATALAANAQGANKRPPLGLKALVQLKNVGLDEEESKTEETATAEDEKNAGAKGASTNWGKANKPVGSNDIDLALVKRLMANIEVGKRQALLADGSAFTNFVRKEANNFSVISAARANKLEENVNTAFLMQRGGRKYFTRNLFEQANHGKTAQRFSH